jgi:transposase
MKITTIGLDLAKNVFQVHGIDTAGEVVVRRALRRGQMLAFFSKLEPCMVGMEACGTSHYWARELGSLGHEVKLMPPAYVKPYVKRGKSDAGDAEAICEAVIVTEARSWHIMLVLSFHLIKLFRQSYVKCQQNLERYRDEVTPTKRGAVVESYRIGKRLKNLVHFAAACVLLRSNVNRT